MSLRTTGVLKKTVLGNIGAYKLSLLSRAFQLSAARVVKKSCPRFIVLCVDVSRYLIPLIMQRDQHRINFIFSSQSLSYLDNSLNTPEQMEFPASKMPAGCRACLRLSNTFFSWSVLVVKSLLHIAFYVVTVHIYYVILSSFVLTFYRLSHFAAPKIDRVVQSSVMIP